MTTRTWRITQDIATADQLAQHLAECSARFVPPLAQRLDVSTYAAKIRQLARRFEAWDSAGRLVGLVAIYDNDGPASFITNVSVVPDMQGAGLARALLGDGLRSVGSGLRPVRLEVHRNNEAAIHLYRTLGFAETGRSGEQINMELINDQSAQLRS